MLRIPFWFYFVDAADDDVVNDAADDDVVNDAADARKMIIKLSDVLIY
jgi:hypothetical protein